MDQKKIVMVIVDVLILIILLIPLLVAVYGKIQTWDETEVFCDDMTIRKPFRGQTVSQPLMLFTTLALPNIFFLINELFFRKKMKVWKIYTILKFYMFGALANMMITAYAKFFAGHLRPYFVAACTGDQSGMTPLPECLNGTAVRVTPGCEDAGPNFTTQAYLSFWSGHSNLCTYATVYLYFYIQHRVTLGRETLLRPLLQFVYFAYALMTSLTRVTDNLHHPSDVLAGAFFGLVIAVAVTNSSTLLKTGNKKKVEEKAEAELEPLLK